MSFVNATVYAYVGVFIYSVCKCLYMQLCVCVCVRLCACLIRIIGFIVTVRSWINACSNK